MDEISHTVAIVVDRTFGDKLLVLSHRLHVWIVDSQINRPARDKVWNETREYTLESGATIFFDDGTQPPDAVVARMLGDIAHFGHRERFDRIMVNAKIGHRERGLVGAKRRWWCFVRW